MSRRISPPTYLLSPIVGSSRYAAFCLTCSAPFLGDTPIQAGNRAAIHHEIEHAPPIAKSRPAAPNIRPEVPPHGECWRQDWNDQPRLGYVRRCPHGRIQILAAVGVDSPIQGPGMNYWRDLSRIWDRRAYKAAARALGVGK